MSKRQIDLEYLKISAKEVFNICLLVLIVALPGTSFGAASNALTLEQSVEKYTSIVSALQRKNELGEKLIGNYQPWKNPILFVDVREPTKFIVSGERGLNYF